MSKTAETSEVTTEMVTEELSWRHLIPVESWAEQCHDTSEEYFDARVRNMDSESHLEAGLDREVERDDPRPERVALFNQRLHEVRGGEQ